jgi:hypothetical protein
MDASRLLEVLDRIEPELTALDTPLSELASHLSTQRSNPGTDYSAQITDVYNTITRVVSASVVNAMPRSQLDILEQIGGTRYLGPTGLEEFKRLFESSTLGWATTAASVEAYRTQFVAFRSKVSTTRTGLRELEIKPHEVRQGDFEVGILIPENVTDSKLDQLTSWFAQWNGIVRTFAEVAGYEDREVEVAGLATGTHELFLSVALQTASYLAMTIAAVTAWYKQILEIRKLRQQLEEHEAPTAETSAVRAHEQTLLKRHIDDLVAEVMAKTAITDKGRINELETQLTISVKQIARFIDKGGDVEVTTAPPEPTDDVVPQHEAVDQIRLSGLAVNQLPRDRTQVFQLGDGSDSDAEAVSDETEPTGKGTRGGRGKSK